MTLHKTLYRESLRKTDTIMEFLHYCTPEHVICVGTLLLLPKIIPYGFTNVVVFHLLQQQYKVPAFKFLYED